ncbi:MAG: ATP-binding protein [Eubacteriales bacterium]|nr:ATP-binding protein [Eubacteriales bacterium]
MKRKIKYQLIGISVVAILITMILMFSIFYDVYKEQVKSDLKTIAVTLKETGIFDKEKETGFYFNNNYLRVTWIDTDGTVLYDNGVDYKVMENHADRPEVRAAFRYGHGSAIRESATMNQSTFYYAVQLDDGAVLRISKVEGNLWSLAENIIPIAASVMLFMVAICIILAQIMTKSIINPIEEMILNVDDYNASTPYEEFTPLVRTIRKQHTDILEAAKMRQDFTANVSHELKTPLTAISGYAELMENNMVREEEVAVFSGKIRQNVDRLLFLINDTIRLSELDNEGRQETMETFDLNELARKCVENLKIYAHKHDVVIVSIGVATSVTGHKEMIIELIDNLCNNAIRYNNKNGNVLVEVGAEEGHAFLRVKDTGIGIPKEQQERVFERFYRVDKSRSKETGGTGLGLAIVKHIVAIHNATIHLKSDLGKGTEITVTF